MREVAAVAAASAGVSAERQCCCEDVVPVMSLPKLGREFFKLGLWVGEWEAACFDSGEKYLPQLTDRSL